MVHTAQRFKHFWLCDPFQEAPTTLQFTNTMLNLSDGYSFAVQAAVLYGPTLVCHSTPSIFIASGSSCIHAHDILLDIEWEIKRKGHN